MQKYKSVFNERFGFREAVAKISDIENAIKSISPEGEKIFITFSNESGKKTKAFEISGKLLSDLSKSKSIIERIPS